MSYFVQKQFTKQLGDWVAKALNTAYQADTDGFAIAFVNTVPSTIVGKTDSANPPTTQRLGSTAGYEQSLSMPVKAGDYWKIDGTGSAATVFWIPTIEVSR